MGGRRFVTVLLVAVIAVVLLNTLAGTADSPVERLLHISRVPIWLPLVFAAALGIALGAVFQKRPGGTTSTGVTAPASPPARKRTDKPAIRGRYAVPRRERRERERQARREAAREEQEDRAREERERVAREQVREAAPPPPVGRRGGPLGWGLPARWRRRAASPQQAPVGDASRAQNADGSGPASAVGEGTPPGPETAAAREVQGPPVGRPGSQG